MNKPFENDGINFEYKGRKNLSTTAKYGRKTRNMIMK